MGGVKSDDCNLISKKIWIWCIKHNIWISCSHIAGEKTIIHGLPISVSNFVISRSVAVFTNRRPTP